jgi:heme/copper-type cytochrome/quinol oxidase subunit 4
MTDQGTEVVEEPGRELVTAEGGAVATTDAEMVPAVFDEHEHPGPRTYVLIAVVLCILTGVEVGLYYLEGDVNSNLLISMLWVLAFAKFFLVCSWYMHMRMDAPFFRRTFSVGIALAGAVYGVVLLTLASTTLRG